MFTYCHVNSDNTESDEGCSVSPLTPLRPITQREEETQDEETEVEVVQYDVRDVDALQVEISLLQRCRQDDECDIVVGLHNNG